MLKFKMSEIFCQIPENEVEISYFDSKAKKFNKIRVEINEETSVKDLRLKAVPLLGLQEDQLEQVHLMNACKPLKEDDLKIKGRFAKIQATKRAKKEEEVEKAKEMSEEEVKNAFFTFGLALRNPSIRPTLERLVTDKDQMEMLAVTVPGLVHDQWALAILQGKPEHLFMLLRPDVLQTVAKKHPALIQALIHLATAVHAENNSGEGQQGQSSESSAPASAFSYHLDDMEDMEEDDDEEGMMVDDDQGAQGGQGQLGGITADQLAAAIQMAQNRSGNNPSNNADNNGIFGGMTGMASQSFSRLPNTSSSTPSTGATGSGNANNPGPSSASSSGSQNVITQDMFAAAMAQAMMATNLSASGLEEETKQKLKEMREVGVFDEALARKALALMGGNVQAAVELIMSGWDGEGDSTN